MDLKKCLQELAESEGVSGSENETAETAMRYLKNYTDNCYIKSGNVIGNFGVRSNDKPHILIDAHLDQVGMIVTFIENDGFIKINNIGGLDSRLLPGQQVIIHGNKNIIGTICSTPPHLTAGKEKKAAKLGDLSIDAGMSKAELEKIIVPGDKISFDTGFKELLNGRITCRAFDDRSGIAAILYALELMKNDNNSKSYTVVFSGQEELGERGAKISAFDICPDIAIAVDVSFGYTTGDKEYECGILGKGPMIGISPSLSRKLSNELIETAEKSNIPFQTEIMNGLTSTNADQFSVNREGCMACTVSIPLRYMHTPVEVIQIDDVANTGKLLAEYIRGC